ncbi:hypothetical protein O6H91_15G083900 [Diphasiastrum complanatum]|uniref:Uncharacterized protein n=1 Tax=Diphasiastrum complanatum TaxID=34168 RepID=A0ACC2BK83_DIPCM|nr:hypothetical protein O6H91_15G083900 [Diphasiastrum complanatum]
MQFGDHFKAMKPLDPSVKSEACVLGQKRKKSTPKEAAVRKCLILEQKCSLPIFSAREKLIHQVNQNNTLIVIGETGSGKTTQLPQFLYAGGFCKAGKIIGITQPRRVAAVSVASRVAEEMDVEVGKEVGFSIRFEDATSSITRIKYMTDGMLLREALLDPLLKKYSVVIVDEAHERTIHTDVLFGLLKGIQARRSNSIEGKFREENGAEWKKTKRGDVTEDSKRNGNDQKAAWPHNQKANMFETSIEKEKDHHANGFLMEKSLSPLKIVIMSATLDAQGFSDYFGGAKVVYIQGRQFPVEIYYTYMPEADYLDAALITTLQVHIEEDPGDVLVFLTGQEEIESMERLLHDRISCFPEGTAKIMVVPIFAALPSDQQMKVFKAAPVGTRKVILATNIAETSVTIPGIRYVIDPGLVKARMYNPRTGVEALAIVPISKAQALQRRKRGSREMLSSVHRGSIS